MQAYLLSGLGAPSSSSVNLFLPLPPRPRVSSNHYYSSLHYHYHYHNNNQSKLKLHHCPPRPTPGGGRNGVIFASAAAAAATNRDHQDHYAVLEISATASSTEIKRAYRRLARKYHPDVCKDSKSGEVFKSIRHAYDVLSNEETRAQHDYKLRFQADPRRQSEKYWQQYEKSSIVVRVSFSEVLIAAHIALFFVQIMNLGSQLYLFRCSLSALYLFSRSLFALSDRKLDGGYKLGYLIAWVLGGRMGILLTLCLSFESWAFGKSSSSLVTPIVVAMWVVTNLAKVGINLVKVGINLAIYPARVGINLARYASSSIPQGALTRVGINIARYASSSIPQGALIALLYMSIRLLQDNLK